MNRVISGEIVLKKTLLQLQTQTVSTDFTVVDNIEWSVAAFKQNNNLGVYLRSALVTEDVMMNVTYEVLGTATTTTRTAKHTFPVVSEKGTGQGFKNMVPWAQLVDNYVVNGKVKIRVKFEKVEVEKKLRFDHILYPDLKIVCKNFEFPVNMAVVAEKSEVRVLSQNLEILK